MNATLETYRWTARDLERLPDVAELRYEIVNGELLVSRRPNLQHQRTLIRLVDAFYGPTRSLGGEVFTEPGIIRGDEHESEDNVIPDFVVILPDRAHIMSGGIFLTGAPNLIVEIISKGTAEADYGAKRLLYQRTGAREYWIIDRFARHVEVWRFDGKTAQSEIFSEDAMLTTTLVPGVHINVADLF